MLLKILLIIVVISVVYFIFFKKKPLKNQSDTKTEKNSSDMVECASCGIYCELNDSILSNGKYYCSQECLESIK